MPSSHSTLKSSVSALNVTSNLTVPVMNHPRVAWTPPDSLSSPSGFTLALGASSGLSLTISGTLKLMVPSPVINRNASANPPHFQPALMSTDALIRSILDQKSLPHHNSAD